jgi:protein SCO1/2
VGRYNRDMLIRQRGAAARTFLIVLVALVAAGLGFWLSRGAFAPGPAGPPTTPAVPASALAAVRLISPPRVLPEWRLRLSDGGEATPATLQGRWTLVFLGFTHCPDVCPTTLQTLSVAQKEWEAALPEARRPRVLFVSADPERDTPQIVGDYAHFFHPSTLAASPTPEQLANFTKALGLVFMKVPGAGGDYSIDHSATLVLLDPQGRQAGLLSPPLDARAIAVDLRLLAGNAQ